MRLIVFALAALLVAPAAAHNKSISFSQWVWQGRTVELAFTVPARDVTLLPAAADATSLDEALGPHLDQHIRVRQITAPCQQQGAFVAVPAQTGYVKMTARYVCFSNVANLTVENNAFFDLAGSHVHFARMVRELGGAGGTEVLFTANQREFTFSADRNGAMAARSSFVQTFTNYFWLGVSHILTGIDHLAFLGCLLLLATSRRHALILVTGFTLGHSVTLAFAALDLVTPNSALIEALIGGSIAIVASETILARRGLMPRVGIAVASVLFLQAGLSVWLGGPIALAGWAGMMLFCASYGLLIRTQDDSVRLALVMTFAFGLFHGFGFGGLLNDIGLPTGQVLGGLFGFNLGVEAGQLMILFPLFVFGPYAAELLPKLPRLGWREIAASGLTGYGVFLFATRALF